jgi:hypothetical protein
MRLSFDNLSKGGDKTTNAIEIPAENLDIK